MRKIYSFQLNKPTKEKVAIKKIIEGKETEILEEVTKDNFLTYFLAKPSISVLQEAELYYESIVAECIRRGIMSQPLMRKRLLNDGGVLSEEQKKQYTELWEKLFKNKADLNQLQEKKEENREKIIDLEKEVTSVLVNLQDFEEKIGSVYDHTAESIAKNRTALWLALTLSYQELNGKNIPIFGEGKFEDKIKAYDEFDKREDPSEFELVQKLLLITSLWYFGKAITKEDFDAILKMKDDKEKQETKPNN